MNILKLNVNAGPLDKDWEVCQDINYDNSRRIGWKRNTCLLSM